RPDHVGRTAAQHPIGVQVRFLDKEGVRPPRPDPLERLNRRELRREEELSAIARKRRRHGGFYTRNPLSVRFSVPRIPRPRPWPWGRASPAPGEKWCGRPPPSARPGPCRQAGRPGAPCPP